MRLRRLDLTRFGKFTDFALDFGPLAEGRPDLHVVFGPNEAGKTTCFEAYLDLLYGMPARSPYNFLHDYDSMQVGGLFEIDGAELALTRIKRQKNDLLDSDGQPVGEAVLGRALSGISRDQYRAMFSLDDDTIEAGGEDILASEGNLGELLFSAAAGLSDLSAELGQIRAEGEAFHKPRGRTTELARAKRELKELQAQIRETDLTASRYRQLKTEAESARAAEAQARATRTDLQRALSQTRAVIACLPRAARRTALLAELEPLAGYPAVAAHWPAEAARLKEAEVAARTRHDSAAEAIARLSDDSGAAPRDPAILAHREAAEDLLDKPRARARAAEDDLPRRRTALAELDGEIRGLHRDLGLSEQASPPAGPVLAAAETAARGVQEAEAVLATHRKETALAAEALARAEEAAPQAGAPGQALAGLIDEIAPEALIQRGEALRRRRAEADDALGAALAALTPWTGAAHDLPRPALAPDQLARRLDEWRVAARTCDAQSERRAAAQLDLDRATARLATLEQDQAGQTDSQAGAARQTRDALWARHAETLTPDTADAFHAAMQQHDALQEARLGMAETLGQIRDARLAVTDARAHLAGLTTQHEAAAAELAALADAFRDLCSTMGLPADFTPADLPQWQDRLRQALDAHSALTRAEAELASVREAETSATIRLRAALGLAEDDPAPLTALARRAQAALLDGARDDERRKALATAQAAHRQRAVGLEAAQAARDAADADWATAASALPGPLQAAPVLLDALPRLRLLLQKTGERDQLAARIAAMESDSAGFAEATARLAGHLNEPPRDTPLATAAALRQRLATALEAEADHRSRMEQLDSQTAARAEATRALDTIADEIATMADAFPGPVASAGDLLDAIARAQRAEALRHEVEALETEITAQLGAADLATALDWLGATDVPEAEARRAALEADLARAEEALEQAIGAARLADQALGALGGDDAVARLSERQATLQVDLSERARHYLRMQIGLAAAEQALMRYRDAHRSGMLSATAEAFRSLTSGHYTDLQTRTSGDKEVLLAIRAGDGRSVAADEMSKGTRFQLYLALRLAGYRDYAARGVALPFLADDIMETFDNTRTSAAIGLLREMGRHGQALYFTHHEHVVDLAREICGADVRIHQIAPA